RVAKARRLRRFTIGYSVQGRRIVAFELGGPSTETRQSGAGRNILVVGCIHGNEPDGIAIARRLLTEQPLSGTAIWIVPVLNPDVVAADTRQNGDGVDLNRNFPWHWRPLGPPGTTFYAGAGALSEREARIAYRLIRRLRPAVSIWFHQHLDVVDVSGGNTATERRFARRVGMRLERLHRYPG